MSNEPVLLDEMREYFAGRAGSDQAWYWSSRWQAMEAESLAEYERGETCVASADDFLASF